MHNLPLQVVSAYNAGMTCNNYSLRGTAGRLPVLALLCLLLPVVCGEVFDFRQGADVPDGWTCVGTAANAERGLKLAETGAYVESPVFAEAVTSLVVVTYCSGGRIDEPFGVLTGSDAGRLFELGRIPYVYTRFATNTYSFYASEDVHVVRIRGTAEGEVRGNYYLSAVEVVREGEAPPREEPSGPDVSATDDWRRSTLVGAGRAEDFAWTTNVVKATPWTNGATVPGFHAFRNGAAVTSVGRDTGRSTAAGLYASRAGDVRSLSLLGTSGSAVTLELHVLNDGPDRLTGAEVSFDACQWTFPEGDPRTLGFAWAVTPTGARPEEGGWRPDPAASYVSRPAAPEPGAPVVAPRASSSGRIAVPPGGRLWLRWSVERLPASPMLGVGNVRLRLLSHDATVLLLR